MWRNYLFFNIRVFIEKYIFKNIKNLYVYIFNLFMCFVNFLNNFKLLIIY